MLKGQSRVFSELILTRTKLVAVGQVVERPFRLSFEIASNTIRSELANTTQAMTDPCSHFWFDVRYRTYRAIPGQVPFSHHKSDMTERAFYE
jgi:hypothetical protein